MKKFLAVLLACALMVSCVPVMALADEEPAKPETKTVTQFVDEQISDLINTIREYVVEYANNEKVVSAITSINEQITNTEEDLVEKGLEILGDVEQVKSTVNDVYTAIKEDKFSEIPKILDKVPFDEIEKYVNQLNDYIHEVTATADEYQKFLIDNDVADKVQHYVEELEEFRDNLKDVIYDEDGNFSIELLIKGIQSYIEENSDEFKKYGEEIKDIYDAAVQFIEEQYPEEYKAISDKVSEIRSYIDGVMEANPEAVEKIKAAIQEVQDYLDSNPDLSADYKKAVQVVLDKVNEYKEDAQKVIDGIAAMIAEYQQQAEGIIANVPGFVEAVQGIINQEVEKIVAAAEGGALAETLRGYIDQVSALLEQVKENGVDTSAIKNLTDKAKDLLGIVASVEAIKPFTEIKSLEDLSAIAQAVLTQYGDKIATKLREMYENGDFDPIFDAIGMTPEELQEKVSEIIGQVFSAYMKIMDIQSYIQGLKEGKGYTDLQIENENLQWQMENLQWEVESYEETLNDLGDQIGSLYETLDSKDTTIATQTKQLTNTQNALRAAKESGQSNSAMVKKLKNAIKVVKGNVKIKTVKAKKGKKLTIAWKPIKGATVTAYKIKVGKKNFTVKGKVKKVTQKNKKLKKILKKIKKGKSVKITVTAVYKVGKTSYTSTISKGKTVKIK